jgi:hypothetical protein
MFLPWYQLTMLAIESQTVIALRLLKLSAGGTAAIQEASRMMSEKVTATTATAATMLSGGGVNKAIRQTRVRVRRNARRLSRRR